MNTLDVEVNIPPKVAETCVAAVGMETTSDALTRSEINLTKTKGGVRLLVRAGDLHALRAAANTYLRWIIMCIDLAENNR